MAVCEGDAFGQPAGAAGAHEDADAGGVGLSRWSPVRGCTKSGSRRWGIAGGLYGREELAAQQVVFGDAPVAAAVKAALDFRVILAAKLARDGRDGLDRSLERSGQVTAPSRGGG